MHAYTSHTRPEISFTEMRTWLFHDWGNLGSRVAECWLEYNKRYFGGRLKPVPIALVSTSPYGHWLGLTRCGEHRTHLIELTSPGQGKKLIADRGVLLHEMVHQHLAETGLSPSHDGEPWCSEVMRLHQAITGTGIWAAPDIVTKERGSRRSVRKKPPAPNQTVPTLGQLRFRAGRTPVGLDLGAL